MHDSSAEAENGVLLGSKLRILRAAHNYTQQFVAEALGVGQPTVSRWEKDEDKINIGDLRKVGELYKVSMEWLLSPDPLVLNIHDNKAENGANGAYNTVNVMPQEMMTQYNAHIEALHKLTERLMDLLGEKSRKGD